MDVMRRLVLASRSDADQWALHATSSVNLGDAVEMGNRALRIDPNSPSALLETADILVEAGEFKPGNDLADGFFFYYDRADDLITAKTRAERAIEILSEDAKGPRQRDPELIAISNYILGLADFYESYWVSSHEHFEQALKQLSGLTNVDPFWLALAHPGLAFNKSDLWKAHNIEEFKLVTLDHLASSETAEGEGPSTEFLITGREALGWASDDSYRKAGTTYSEIKAKAPTGADYFIHDGINFFLASQEQLRQEAYAGGYLQRVVGDNFTNETSAGQVSLVIVRDFQDRTGTYGHIELNGKNMGAVLEPNEKLVPEGLYSGVIRDTSAAGHTINGIGDNAPEAKLTDKFHGDFLLQFKGTPGGMSAVQIHVGNTLQNTDGCMLIGTRVGSLTVYDKKTNSFVTSRGVLNSGVALKAFRDAILGTASATLASHGITIKIIVLQAPHFISEPYVSEGFIEALNSVPPWSFSSALSTAIAQKAASSAPSKPAASSSPSTPGGRHVGGKPDDTRVNHPGNQPATERPPTEHEAVEPPTLLKAGEHENVQVPDKPVEIKPPDD